MGRASGEMNKAGDTGVGGMEGVETVKGDDEVAGGEPEPDGAGEYRWSKVLHAASTGLLYSGPHVSGILSPSPKSGRSRYASQPSIPEKRLGEWLI